MSKPKGLRFTGNRDPLKKEVMFKPVQWVKEFLEKQKYALSKTA